jgi:hypothetical protein
VYLIARDILSQVRMMSNILAQAIIDIQCKFCGEQCFAPLTTQAPAAIQRAYQRRNINVLATCPGGQAFEKLLVGYSMGDVLASVVDYALEPGDIAKKGACVLCSSMRKNGAGPGSSL